MGRPEETAAREVGVGVAQKWRGPARLPPQPRRLTRGTHATERQVGEENRAVAKLIAGDSSGEPDGATVFTTSVRI